MAPLLVEWSLPQLLKWSGMGRRRAIFLSASPFIVKRRPFALAVGVDEVLASFLIPSACLAL